MAVWTVKQLNVKLKLAIFEVEVENNGLEDKKVHLSFCQVWSVILSWLVVFSI